MFALASDYEGFPNALLEAMASGMAVVSSDCPSGPRELIEHDVNGLLVPVDDVAAFARALKTLMQDDTKRATLGQNALIVRDRYSIGSIMSQWDALVDSPTKGPHETPD